MNSTLNNLALLSFKRKARKLGKNIEVANLTDQGFFEEYLVRAGETLIIWGEENGFHSIFTENDKELAYLVNFPDKYGYDEVYHFGILNPDKTKLYVYRCYDQLTHQNEVLAYGLQYQTEEYKRNQDFELQQESELPFLQQGRGSYL
ncbi:MAG: hypothetical protein KBB75_02510 [Candidatus Pacebacteria bacterium]|jgi:hypothetical protein|nr:hypothetical protein [Candidatus Paceibacterota bacterium]